MLKQETLEWLSKQQKILDEKIIAKHNLIVNQAMLYKKIIAFWVELGEYANEEKSFKYWKQGASGDRHVQLEEYIDGLHFIISIGNQTGFVFETYNYVQFNLANNLDCYFTIINQLTLFKHNPNSKNFSDLLSAFLAIASVQNYTEQELIEAYKIKHQKNQQRQIENY